LIIGVNPEDSVQSSDLQYAVNLFGRIQKLHFTFPGFDRHMGASKFPNSGTVYGILFTEIKDDLGAATLN
jgi:hypothetical protein